MLLCRATPGCRRPVLSCWVASRTALVTFPAGGPPARSRMALGDLCTPGVGRFATLCETQPDRLPRRFHSATRCQCYALKH